MFFDMKKFSRKLSEKHSKFLKLESVFVFYRFVTSSRMSIDVGN